MCPAAGQTTMAALILAHHSPELLNRLVSRLESYGAKCYVHIDAGVDIAPFQAACSLTGATFIEHRVELRWGGFSIVAATINLLSAALADPRLTHFILTSGDSYPIKSREQFRELAMRPFDQIELGVVQPESLVYQRIAHTFLPDTSIGAFLHREGDPSLQRFITEDFLADIDRIKRIFEMKKGRFPWRYAKGSQWWILTRATAQRCLQIIESEKEFVEWFIFSSVPDEALFQTIVENFGPFEIRKSATVYTVWWRSPRPFLFIDSADLDSLKAAPAPLARKFSSRQGAPLLDLLDRWMDSC